MGNCMSHFLAKPHAFEIPGLKSTERLQNFRKEKAAIYSLQNLSTTDAFPEFLNDLRKKFQTLPIFDEGYRAIFDIRNLQGIKARFVIIDSKSLMFMLLDDEKFHPNYDIGVWINTEFFAQALEQMFELAWKEMKSVK